MIYTYKCQKCGQRFSDDEMIFYDSNGLPVSPEESNKQFCLSCDEEQPKEKRSITVQVQSSEEALRKIQAFRELYGKPDKVYASGYYEDKGLACKNICGLVYQEIEEINLEGLVCIIDEKKRILNIIDMYLTFEREQ